VFFRFGISLCQKNPNLLNNSQNKSMPHTANVWYKNIIKNSLQARSKFSVGQWLSMHTSEGCCDLGGWYVYTLVGWYAYPIEGCYACPSLRWILCLSFEGCYDSPLEGCYVCPLEGCCACPLEGWCACPLEGCCAYLLEGCYVCVLEGWCNACPLEGCNNYPLQQGSGNLLAGGAMKASCFEMYLH